MKKTTVMIVLLAGAMTGCQNFKKEHPDFPKWGWWKKHPATQPTIPPTSQSASQPTTAPAGKPAGQPVSQPASGPASRSTGQAPVDHRQEVWRHVARMRDMDSYPPARQKELIAYAQEHLQAWYKPMKVPPPDMTRPDWLIVMIWDFMPPEDFHRAAVNWKKIADDAGEEFPKNITRRGLMKFVQKMQENRSR